MVSKSLYERHQDALVLAYRATSDRSHQEHQSLADAYGQSLASACTYAVLAGQGDEAARRRVLAALDEQSKLFRSPDSLAGASSMTGRESGQGKPPLPENPAETPSEPHMLATGKNQKRRRKHASPRIFGSTDTDEAIDAMISRSIRLHGA